MATLKRRDFLRTRLHPFLRLGGPVITVRRMSVEDRVMVVAARRVLTAMWVDITQISVRTTRGVVYLTGHLQRMTASHSDFTPTSLREIDQRLHQIRGVRDVKYRLDNWRRNVDGGWAVGPPEENVTLEVEESTGESVV
jgi:hypothetical protein